MATDVGTNFSINQSIKQVDTLTNFGLPMPMVLRLSGSAVRGAPGVPSLELRGLSDLTPPSNDRTGTPEW